MYQLAECPRCGTLQLQRLGPADARECRSCETLVPAGDWVVREEHEAFEDARDALRERRPRGRGGGFSSGPAVPEAAPLTRAVDAESREALFSVLEDLAGREEPVAASELVGALADVGCGHLLGHLRREGWVEAVDAAGDEPVYRVHGPPDPA